MCRYSLTQITVDWGVYAAERLHYDVLFIGTGQPFRLSPELLEFSLFSLFLAIVVVVVVVAVVAGALIISRQSRIADFSAGYTVVRESNNSNSTG